MSENSLFTTKSIKKLIIPLIFEQFMIVMVSLFDTLFLATTSESALAAFSLVDNINLLLMQVFMVIGAGGSIIAAQYIGSRDSANAENTANQTTLMVLLVSLAIALPAILLNGPLLRAIYPKVSPVIMRFCQQYFLLSAISYPAYALYNGATSLLYAQSQSRLSMVTSVAMNLIKILLNFVLIRAMNMGIQGAGLATIVSRLTGAVMANRFLMNPHMQIHYTRPIKIRFDRGIIKRILSVALPSGTENIIFLACKLVIGIMIAGYSGAMIAANAAANTISSYISIPGNAITLAAITIVSQCVGAGSIEEAKRNTIKLQIVTMISIAVLSVMVLIAVNPVVNMLGLSPEAAMHTRTIVILYCILAIFFWAPAFGLPGSLRAAGDNRFVMLAAVFSVVVFRTGGSYLLGNVMGLQVQGIWYAMYADWVVRSAFFLFRFKSGKWLRHHLI